MIRTTRSRKSISFFLCLIILLQVIIPSNSFALTSGPNQPEFSGFQAIGVDDNVDMFSGDFNYTIPIYEIGGYPLNLSYKSGSGVETEASWVGLGWELSTGMINRNLRGIPDDFQGDEYRKEITMKDNYTIGLSPGLTAELFGFGIGFGGGLFYNSYNGFGIEASINNNPDPNLIGVVPDFGLSYNSQSGVDVTLGLSLGAQSEKGNYSSASFSGGFNSRQGLKSLNFSGSPSQALPKRASMSINPINYTPVPSISYENVSFSLSTLFGGEIIGFAPGGRLSGYFNNQSLASKEILSPAYGTFYLEDSKQNPDALLDFNHDQYKPYQMESPSMSPVVGTHDIFNVSTGLMQGQFRAHRNDIGAFYNAESKTISADAKISLEFGVGNAAHNGGDIGGAYGNANKGLWKEDNSALNQFGFTKDGEFGARYESKFLKMAGETHMTDSQWRDKYIDNAATRVQLEKHGLLSVVAAKQFVADNHLIENKKKSMTTKLTRNTDDRIPRNHNISYLTNLESVGHNINPSIKHYPFNTFSTSNCAVDSSIEMEISRVEKPSHHISEMAITDENGMRFRFGIPVYNMIQQEMTFSTSVNSSSDNIVTYSATEASKNNKSGRDNYYSLEETPPYSTAFLLTEIQSHDYYDRTGDGISFDDPGSSIKFNYSRTENYKWRFPVSSTFLKGRFNPGYRTDPSDNKVSVVYGERENWYPHSIESNLEVLQFYTSNRNDALGVFHINGAVDPDQRMKKLDSILVFSKSELLQFGANAVPLRTVVFEYQDLSDGPEKQILRLSPNINSTNEGRLVLKGVYTKYKDNHTQYNKYDFIYNSSFEYLGNTRYYNYKTNGADRWGNYRIDNSSMEPYILDYPYVFQDADHAQISANAFNLNTIKLPSGGELKIEYESDDYAFVQDKRAGQMIKIKGFTSLTDNDIKSELYSGNDYGNINDINSYLVFDLPHPVPFPRIKSAYFQDVEKIYFNVFYGFDRKRRL